MELWDVATGLNLWLILTRSTFPSRFNFLPQTWEDPEHRSEDCDGYIGDNDPVDVVEIGNHTAKTGEIYVVKPLAGAHLAALTLGQPDLTKPSSFFPSSICND